MTILAIETSCDETAIALVEARGGLRNPSFNVLKNLVSSQVKIHRPFGGVVPNLAKREHIKNLPILLKKIMNHELRIKGNGRFKKAIIHNSKFIIPDMVAVTVGPGLEPALWTGINFAKKLTSNLQLPTSRLFGVNHLEAHIYSNILQNVRIFFPAICLLVSGGHTILLKIDSLTKWKKLGETRDDAAGEAFDKVARLLALPYPGGPEIEKLAQRGNPEAIHFPRPMINQKNFDFSFSGLKTAVLYYLRENKRAKKSNIAASFQKAVIDVLVKKTIRAAREFRVKSVLLCGGVAANSALRAELERQATSDKKKFFVPAFEYNTDNAAMIAAAAYIRQLEGKKYRLAARANLNL